MGTVNAYRPKAALGKPRSDQGLLAFIENVELKMTNNPNFPNLGTLISDLESARKGFATAITTKSNQKGAANTLTAARQGVNDQLNHVKDFVNAAAEKAPPDQAKAIIESAGLRVKKHATLVKLPLEVKYGGVAGAVVLVAAAAARSAVYYFEYSIDQKSWTACPNSWKCKTSLTGLTVGTMYYFRFRAETRKGLGDWSAVVTFVVR
jgi:hypothetical protein